MLHTENPGQIAVHAYLCFLVPICGKPCIPWVMPALAAPQLHKRCLQRLHIAILAAAVAWPLRLGRARACCARLLRGSPARLGEIRKRLGPGEELGRTSATICTSGEAASSFSTPPGKSGGVGLGGGGGISIGFLQQRLETRAR